MFNINNIDRNIELFIFDIYIAIQKITKVSNKFNNVQDLLYDFMAWDSVVREFEIIGEATKYLLRDQLLEKNYQEVVDFRNQIIHAYFGIDQDIVWEIINFDEIIEVPYLSGCFMFLRTKTLKKSGLFDENIFLHTEDTDLSRRIFEVAKNIYYPNVFIYHEHNKEAYRSKKVLLMQIKSIIYYFNKWGWFFDKKRNIINKEIINKYGENK
jgi:uncharacterized protein with HEPN domain